MCLCDRTDLSDKQQTSLMEIYGRMPHEAGQLAAKGFHHDALDAVLWEICFTNDL